MSEDGTAAEGVAASMKSGDPTYGPGEAPQGQLDSASRKRVPPTARQIRSAVAFVNGATSTGAAMVEGGFSPWTARNPTENGITPARLLAVAAEVLPGAPTATTIKRDGLDLVHAAMRKVSSDPDARPMDMAQIGGSAAKLGHDIGGSDEQDQDLNAAASLADFLVHQAQQRLELARQMVADGADVPAILDQLQDDLKAATEEQAAFHYTHGRKAQR